MHCGSQNVIEARNHLLRTLRDAARAINAGITQLDASLDLVDGEIEKTYTALAWAVDSFREEQELASMDAEFSREELAQSKRGSGRFAGQLRA
jgi:hypothetical protein